MTSVGASRSGASFFDDVHDDEEDDLTADDTASTGGRRLRRLARRMLVLTVLPAAASVFIATVGTIATASADPSPTDWSRLRMCESSGNYATDTGNGYYGAYQFDLSTWRSVGGTGSPNLATPAEQDARALVLYRERGWQPWTCAGILGLREDSDARSGRINDIGVPATGSTAVAPTQSGAPDWPGPQYFSIGDHSSTIARWQAQMHTRGSSLVGTGDFGPNTLAVVKRIQGENGLPQTGILGPVTWALAWTGTY